MTNINLRKTIFTILITVISFCSFSNSGGVLVKDLNNEALLNISTQYNWGRVWYKLDRFDTPSKDALVFFRIGDTYYNQFGWAFNDQAAFVNAFDNMSLEAPASFNFYGETGTVRKGKAFLDHNTVREAEVEKETKIALRSTLDKILIQVWIITESNEVIEIKLKVLPNFFDGEEQFFKELYGSDYSSLTVLQKSIFFMSTFFAEEIKDANGNITSIQEIPERDEFVKVVCNSFVGVGPSDIPRLSKYINNSNFHTLYPNLVKNKNLFKSAFASHFKLGAEKVVNKADNRGREAVLPYLDIDKESFDLIYSTGRTDVKSPYIAAYLAYIEEESQTKSSKPILSYLINKRVNESDGSEIKYDYTQYKQITPDEGASIAEAALRYMTWGVEYTTKSNSIWENNNSDYMVYENNFNMLEAWTKNPDLSPELRATNYFSGDYKPIPRPTNVDENSALGKMYAKGLVTTPFGATPGNPIAYAPMGIDSPKTFNYKMLMQNEARKWILERHSDDPWIADSYPEVNDSGIVKTTLAKKVSDFDVISYQNSYFDEIDLYKEAGKNIDNYELDPAKLPTLDAQFLTIEPYLPGFKHSGMVSYSESPDSIFHPNKAAGVDSLGLLMGAIASSKVNGNFLDVFNTKVDEELDTYYKGKPAYHVEPSNNILNKPYRFTKSDFEKNSVLLPELRMARPGDILVSYTSDTPHVGIIISADFSGLTSSSTAEEYMERITVISTKSGYRMANIGVWKNPHNVFSGFTAPGEEKSYHLRRLVKKSEGGNNRYVMDKLEIFDTELSGLEIDLELPKIQDKVSHWVPNTGELYTFKSIKIKGNYANSIRSLDEGDRNITILPPVDQYYSEQSDSEAATDKSNIYRNKGKGLKFYAVKGTDAVHLATITYDPTLGSMESESPYIITYSPDIFDITGKPKGNFKLYVDNNKLTFKVISNGIFKKDTVYTSFAIRPLEEGIRPGDDFLLRFGLQDVLGVAGTAKDEDFVAVYDKKMLWRANLYIDDTAGDWNDFNKWNAPTTEAEANISGELRENNKVVRRYLKADGTLDSTESSYIGNGKWVVNSGEKIWYGPNEWNKEMNHLLHSKNHSTKNVARDGKDMKWEDLSLLEMGNGGQQVTFPSAVYYKSASNNKIVNRSVSYSYIRTTTPFEYNFHIYQQYQAMKSKADTVRNNLENAETALLQDPTDISLQANYKNALDEYNNNIYTDLIEYTMLPPLTGLGTEDLLGRWKRYIENSFKPGAKDVLRYGNSPLLPFEQPQGTTVKFGKTYNHNEAGIDCGGLVYMSEAYIGTPYIRTGSLSAIDAIRTAHDCGEGTESDGYPVFSNLHKVMDHSEYVGLSKSGNRKRVVPGDIIYYHGYHVMIVSEVNIVNGNREIELEDISIIESTNHPSLSTGAIQNVGNTTNLSVYVQKKWYLGRLKTK